MKAITIIVLLLYQIIEAIMVATEKDKELKKQILLIVQLIPLFMAIILAM